MFHNRYALISLGMEIFRRWFDGFRAIRIGAAVERGKPEGQMANVASAEWGSYPLCRSDGNCVNHRIHHAAIISSLAQ